MNMFMGQLETSATLLIRLKSYPSDLNRVAEKKYEHFMIASFFQNA